MKDMVPIRGGGGGGCMGSWYYQWYSTKQRQIIFEICLIENYEKNCFKVIQYSCDSYHFYQPIYGYGSSDEMPFRSTNVKDAEIFFVEEKDVSIRELALGTVIPTDPGKTTVKGNAKTHRA